MKNNYKEGPILIDCTLRDGGYYNKWDFESSLIKKYLYAVAAAGINFVEIGLIIWVGINDFYVQYINHL